MYQKRIYKYDKRMFHSRQMISRSGFFDPLIEKISLRIKNEYDTVRQTMKILDAGCGEGSQLSNIREKINQHTTHDFLGVGVDISKEGIHIASTEYSKIIWCVADIAKCPFDNNQFDFILNILSPSNYSEFKRMLTDDGMVIKVIPEKNYLKELRDIFYGHTHKEIYSNENTLKHFQHHFDVVDIEHVHYSVMMDHSLIEHLVRMTPLSWRATEEKRQQIFKMNLAEITVDFTILFGKNQK